MDWFPLLNPLCTLTFCKLTLSYLFSYSSCCAFSCYFFKIYYNFDILSSISWCSGNYTIRFLFIMFYLADECDEIGFYISLRISDTYLELFYDYASSAFNIELLCASSQNFGSWFAILFLVIWILWFNIFSSLINWLRTRYPRHIFWIFIAASVNLTISSYVWIDCKYLSNADYFFFGDFYFFSFFGFFGIIY